MTNLTTYLTSNQYLLKQIRDELENKDYNLNTIYSAPIPIIGGASIGAHLRHILDFYGAFYYGIEKGHINYDKRQRNPDIESNVASGVAQITAVIEQLATLKHAANKDVEINASVEVDSTESYGRSNLIRELQSLHSHTTHHMAIIAIVFKLNNIKIDDDFGKAPSTIQYEHSLNSCNRLSGEPLS